MSGTEQGQTQRDSFLWRMYLLNICTKIIFCLRVRIDSYMTHIRVFKILPQPPPPIFIQPGRTVGRGFDIPSGPIPLSQLQPPSESKKG